LLTSRKVLFKSKNSLKVYKKSTCLYSNWAKVKKKNTPKLIYTFISYMVIRLVNNYMSQKKKNITFKEKIPSKIV